MKIDVLIIKGLFRTFDYEIKLSTYKSPFIITGLNGYGKTTILNIIKRLSEKDFFYFYRLPFNEITISFDNGAKVTISSREEILQECKDENGDDNLTVPRIVTFVWTYQNVEYKFELNRKEISSAAKFMYRNGHCDNRYDVNSDGFYEQTLRNKAFYGYFGKNNNFNLISMMLDSLKVTFITAQRLEPIVEEVYEDYPFDSETIRKPKISEVSCLIKKRLEQGKASFQNKSEYIDNKLMDSLLSDTWAMNEEAYSELKNNVSKKISDLKSFGLVGNIIIHPYDKDHQHILSVYLRNMDEKLRAYDYILSKLKLFNNMISSLDFVNKTVFYNPEKGLSIKTVDGLFLDENKLSSGEQNEIVMLYEMIFEVADNSILLVDEPEISLHVAWQNKFIDMMADIASNNNIQVVVATHSPQIIGDRWSECYDLCENV